MVDFRKILICSGIIILSVFPSINEPKAFAVTILIQGASNIDSYWDFLKEKRIHKSLKGMLILAIVLSFMADVIALLCLGSTQNFFENAKFGIIVKTFVLSAISFPIALLIKDIREIIKYNQKGGEEGEL